jgi:hypothetical protein
VGDNVGPFTIYDQVGNIIAEDVTKDILMEGTHYTVADDVVMITLSSTGTCMYEKTIPLADIYEEDFFFTETEQIRTGCLWAHLKNPTIYNTFYGTVQPYIIEYPFAYQYQDEILQIVKDYTKVYQYFEDEYDVANEPAKIETDDIYFNKSILYNGQQCSGILNLVPKPKHNLKLYNSYPLYTEDGKTIMFTKSDNFYQYNTFWSIVKDKSLPLFIRTCSPLSYDKEINQSNMEYTDRSFKKEPLRAKELKIRHCLDDRGDVHLVSQFLFTPTQISYK